MGAGQVGGVATLLDLDLENAAGFVGKRAEPNEAQFVVLYLSHALLFCTGSLIEAHIVLTPAVCVVGEYKKFPVYAGSHKFLETTGVSRKVEHICSHRDYNRTEMKKAASLRSCSVNNLALLVLDQQYHLHQREENSEYVINRLRYGINERYKQLEMTSCSFYGWGSRRNGFLVPLLIHLRKVEVTILHKDVCPEMWNPDGNFLCLADVPCKSEKFGAMCPDDVGSVIECQGFLKGMMVSRLLDRPCGVGFLDMHLVLKFIACGVDGARDLIEDHDFERELDAPVLAAPIASVSQIDELPPDETDEAR